MYEEKFENIKTKDDYVKMLYTPENIEAAGGIENFQKAVKKWKKHDTLLGIKNNITCFIEFFGSKLLTIALIIGIIILALQII